MANNARIPNIEPLIAAGIDPKTGLPLKLGASPTNYKAAIKKNLRIMDEQNHINRFKWYNLPDGLTGQLVERMLYYRGQLAFFYMEANQKFYMLPYALSTPKGEGTGLDIYGRFTGITPLTFNGSYSSEDDRPFIQGLTKRTVYDIILPEDLKWEDITDSAVLLSDYSKQYSQTVISRQMLNDEIVDMMSEAMPMARTALLANSGIKGMRVNDADQQANVKLASKSVQQAALNGDPWVPFVGAIEFQDFTNGGTAYSPEDFLLYMQSLDNLRLSFLGLGSGGIYEKKAHMLEAEQSMNNTCTTLVYNDSLELRQEFCNIVNSIWGLGIWCEPSEAVTMVDNNMDAALTDEDNNEMDAQQADGGAANE